MSGWRDSSYSVRGKKPSRREEKSMARQQLQEDVDAFLAKGGKITKVPRPPERAVNVKACGIREGLL